MNQNNNDANNNDMLESITAGGFLSLSQIEREIDEMDEKLHKMEIEDLNRQHKEKLEKIAAAVEDYVYEQYLTTDDELDDIRKLILE